MKEKEIRLEIIKILARRSDEPENTVDDIINLFNNKTTLTPQQKKAKVMSMLWWAFPESKYDKMKQKICDVIDKEINKNNEHDKHR